LQQRTIFVCTIEGYAAKLLRISIAYRTTVIYFKVFMKVCQSSLPGQR